MGMLNLFNNIHNFDPSSPIPGLADKVILVTGGNQGVGRASVHAIARHSPGPKRLYLAARSREKYDAAIDIIKTDVPNAESKITFLQLDLADLDSVKKAADQVIADNDRLDILMNNAGVMGQPASQTKQGYEIHFGTNHMGHALLTRQLLPLLQKTAERPDSDVRIVILSPIAHMVTTAWSGVYIPFDDASTSSTPPPVKTSMPYTHSYFRYGASKTANILHARELARRYPDITTVSIHPGRVSTNLLTHMFASWFSPTAWFQRTADVFVGKLSVEQGAMNQLWAAFGKKDQMVSGTYYCPVGVDEGCDRRASNDETAGKLWHWQELEFESLGF